MLFVFEITVIFITVCCSIHSVRRLNRSTVYFMHLFFVFICVVPLFLDYCIGRPVYSVSYPVFTDSRDDATTRALYCVFLLVIQSMLLWYGNRVRRKEIMRRKSHVLKEQPIENKEIFYTEKSKRIFFFVAAFVPVLAVCLRIPFEYFLTWSWRYDSMDISTLMGYSSLERLSYLGVVASMILLCLPIKKRIKLLAFILLYMNICIEGKRSAVFFALIVFVVCFIFYSKKKVNLLPLTIIGIIAIVLIVSLTFGVQSDYRGYTASSDLYRMLRVDIFRDDTIKSAIYFMIYPNKGGILDYPLQSIVMQIGYLFPLVWTGIPKVGYETYMTAALKYLEIDGLTNGTRMTVSFFDCAIANLGILGFIVGGIITILFALLTDRCSKEWRPIVICGFILYSMYSWAYICWYFQFWIIFYFLTKYRIVFKWR